MPQTLMRLLTLITLCIVLTACSHDQTFKYQTKKNYRPLLKPGFNPAT